jgi:V/A-type H+-transporting ATPase subunit I
MAIVPLLKLTLCGLKADKQSVLEQLQNLGKAHLISLNKLVVSSESATHQYTEKVLEALKYLNQSGRKRHQVINPAHFDLDAVVDQVLAVRQAIRQLTDHKDFLLNRIEEIKPWGNFNLVPDQDMGGYKCWFYIVPKRLMKKLDAELIYQVVHEDNINCYVVVLSRQEPSSSQMPVPRSHTGKKPLHELENELHALELAIEDKIAERESLTRWIGLMTRTLSEYQSNVELKVAHSITRDDEHLFMLQAWIPEPDKALFEQFAEQHQLAMMLETVAESELPPTLLSNKELLAGGEEVVRFYQTPAYSGWDPSITVFFSFALFFAMILSDAGYALMFAVFIALKWRRLGQSMQGRRLRVLASIALCFSMIWGVLIGSYFGFTPQPETLAGQLKILDINDFDSMMRLSILVGALHIILANAIRAIQLYGKKTMLAAVAWILLIVGGVLIWLQIPDLLLVAQGFLIIGGVMLLLFSSDQPVTKPMDLLWQLVDGLKNLTSVTKIFGDILSYMRLFALGLASASLALTFNDLAQQVYSSVSGLGLLFSILIMVLGHGLNLLLCLMSGVVHGLRLNFIEFYNWSVSDEGYPFKSFSKKGEI